MISRTSRPLSSKRTGMEPLTRTPLGGKKWKRHWGKKKKGVVEHLPVDLKNKGKPEEEV